MGAVTNERIEKEEKTLNYFIKLVCGSSAYFL